MSATVIDDLTPTRKRKRDSEKLKITTEACFTNAAFSSTPKKLSGRRRLIPASMKENQMPYSNNTCMEVKSIAELVKEQKESATPTIFNPYEVQRKPPKKKKREAIEHACFENPALNLNVPEKQLNPFEVVRSIEDGQEQQRKCFVNEALNIKGQDSSSCVRNPFEIQRCNAFTEDLIKKGSIGVENLALENTVAPTSLKLGIPFTPTVGCRIDFNNVSLSQLTPNKLLLAEKLVFSPVPSAIIHPKRSLDAISEEPSSTSIGKELDRYQLELENSINEAKLRKNDGNLGIERFEEERVYQLQLKVEKRVSLNQRLTEIPEGEEYETEENEQVIIETTKNSVPASKEIQVESVQTEIIADAVETVSNTFIQIGNTNDGVQQQSIEHEERFDSEDEPEDFDFKAPTPFVRSYRRDLVTKPKLRDSKESLNSNDSSKSYPECNTQQKNHSGMKNLLRKSIRKIMPHQKQQAEHLSSADDLKSTDNKKIEEPKQCTLTSHIMSSIRHSLRRRPKAPADESDKLETEIPMAEISIIDTSERKMKLKSSAPRNDYARIEELTTEKKHLLRNGSLRRSMMKTLFHKQEEYSFQK